MNVFLTRQKTLSKHGMRQPTTNILTTFLTAFFVNLAFGQPIRKDEKVIHLDDDTQHKVSMMAGRLAGTWQLVKTIRYENGDTIIQEPSIQLWLTPGAKPFTTIRIDSLSNFEIEQACMKCPYLFWKGQYEITIKTLKGLGVFYLNFIDSSQKTIKGKKRKKAFALAFNGHLTNFENNALTLTDKEGTEWVYNRQ